MRNFKLIASSYMPNNLMRANFANNIYKVEMLLNRPFLLKLTHPALSRDITSNDQTSYRNSAVFKTQFIK